MPRDSIRKHEAGREAPYYAWVLTVDVQNRVRLPKEISVIIPWLGGNAAPVECTAMLGPFGGIQLAPSSAEAIEPRAEFDEKLRKVPPKAGDASSKWADIARCLATSWKVTIQKESSRYSLTLPEAARKLGVAPNAGDTVVVFAAGELLELWPAKEWVQHIRRTAGEFPNALRATIDLLDGRGQD